MNPKDKSMICRMAGNIAGPLLAQALSSQIVGVNGGLNVLLSVQDIDDIHEIVAASALKCALCINKLAEEKLK